MSLVDMTGFDLFFFFFLGMFFIAFCPVIANHGLDSLQYELSRQVAMV